MEWRRLLTLGDEAGGGEGGTVRNVTLEVMVSLLFPACPLVLFRGRRESACAYKYKEVFSVVVHMIQLTHVFCEVKSDRVKSNTLRRLPRPRNLLRLYKSHGFDDYKSAQQISHFTQIITYGSRDTDKQPAGETMHLT